jgi:site-specific DNA-methyltransferase (adenine-specific)
MTIINKSIKEIKPYENNPRKNATAVDLVKNSIEEFGFKVPIVIAQDGTIVCGHTRFYAAKKLKLSTIPCIVADDLTPAQLDAFRLIDNKTGEKAEWDYELMMEELSAIENLDMAAFDFDFGADETSFIDDLLEEDFVSKQLENKLFNLTLNFNTSDKEEVMLYLLKKGKEALSDEVIRMAEESEEL